MAVRMAKVGFALLIGTVGAGAVDATNALVDGWVRRAAGPGGAFAAHGKAAHLRWCQHAFSQQLFGHRT